jgi:hypothetical protein
MIVVENKHLTIIVAGFFFTDSYMKHTIYIQYIVNSIGSD